MDKHLSSSSVTVEFPPAVFQQLEQTAQRQNRSISEVVRDLVLQELPGLPSLPKDIEAELAAFANLSDEVLRLLASTTMSRADQGELAELNHKAQRESLSDAEEMRQDVLISIYDEVMVRRAHATAILRARGHDVNGLLSTSN